ncbi:MAG: Asp23/Gls24 family envelope stress response protein [Lachnospiraceae bacterium]|nr:Asp23/Gls24 family envelope stress response protein [Lachnospiraceae bacterium]
MKYRISTEQGDVIVDSDVIATYAGTVAMECYGIVGMSSVNMKDGLSKLLKREHLANGINVTIEDNTISLDFHVIVSLGVSIAAVTESLIESVRYKVEEFTGAEIKQINVYVEGVRATD